MLRLRNGKVREVPIHPQLRQPLTDWLDAPLLARRRHAARPVPQPPRRPPAAPRRRGPRHRRRDGRPHPPGHAARRDAFAISDGYCERAAALLAEVLGEHLRRRYFHGSRGADLAILLRNGEAELLDATPDDVDRVAVAMVTLATVLQDAFAPPPPDNESPTDRAWSRPGGRRHSPHPQH
ncbi:hypothetical protein [Nonomuraea sp. NPDC050202]|uniref:hypothetical protein n=1 Tax=Nonomuraea sp. NPDC050202 TaxID=3155035 RepID=UPI0033FC987E